MDLQNAESVAEWSGRLGVLDREEDPRRPFSEEACGVIDALIAAPIAWRTPAHLAHDSGLDLNAVNCGLADLEAAGLVCHWETEAELSVTLTPIGAKRLGVRLVEAGPDELPRWASPEKPEPSPPKAKGVFRDYEALFCVVGPTPPAEVLAEVAEEMALADEITGRPADRPGRAPRLIGADLPFPGRPKEPGPCLVCKDSLGPDDFCLYCTTAGKKPARSQRTKTRAAKRFAHSSALAAVRRRRAG